MNRKHAIIAIAVLPTLLGLALLLVFSRFTMERWIQTRTLRDYSAISSTLALDIQTQLQTQKKLLELMAQGSEFASLPKVPYVDRSINGLPESLEPGKRKLMEILRQQAGFSVVFVLQPSGDHYISHPFSVQRTLKQFNLSERPYFRSARESGRTVISDVFVGADGLPAIAMDTPVRDGGGSIVAHVGGVVHLKKLQSFIEAGRIAPFDLAFLMDAKGQMLARSDAESPQAASAELISELHKASVSPDASNTTQQSRNLRIGGTADWVVFSHPAGAGWTLHTLRDGQRLLEEVAPIAWLMNTAAAITLLVPMTLGLWLALRYSRRAHLADKALVDANSHLEERVQDRTRELARSELRLRTLFESAVDAILILEEQRVVECNPAAVTLFGVADPNELIGKNPAVFSPPVQPNGMHSDMLASEYLALLRQTPDRPVSFEWTHKRADSGQAFVAMVRLSLMEVDGRILTQANVRDITDRIRAQEDLRIASKVFESWEGMTITNERHVILRVNSAFTRITGYSAQEALGKTPRLLQSGLHGPQFYQAMEHALSTDGFWQGEMYNRRKSGEVYPQILTISAVKNSGGQVTHYVGIFLDQTHQKAVEQQIEKLAFYDPLTGLANRRLLLDRLEQARSAGARHNRHSALLLIDLDEFKVLNDTLGHESGDAMLKQLAQRLRHCVRDGDTAARYGGDEFAVMLEDLSSDAFEAASQAELVAEKLRHELGQPCSLPSRTHRTTCSIGVALFGGSKPATGDSPLKQAEVAMFQAKGAGRNAVRFFEPHMQEAVNRRAALEEALRHGIEHGELLLQYQPQVSGEGRVCGVEALVRWQHPQRGLVPPVEFIPMAEETGLILPLGQWVLEEACRQLARWAEQPETRNLTVAVNVSARQFHHPQFVDIVRHTLEATHAPAALLKLELTESMLAEDLEELIAKMKALRTLGVRFSLDDFGTGYSSLVYLKRLPIDQLKIDQGFVRHLLTDANDVAIAKMVVALARSLNLSVIAEGVEHDEQRDCLSQLGCHEYQGYLFGKPMPPSALEATLIRTNPG